MSPSLGNLAFLFLRLFFYSPFCLYLVRQTDEVVRANIVKTAKLDQVVYF